MSSPSLFLGFLIGTYRLECSIGVLIPSLLKTNIWEQLVESSPHLFGTTRSRLRWLWLLRFKKGWLGNKPYGKWLKIIWLKREKSSFSFFGFKFIFSTVGSIFGFISVIPLSQEKMEILLFCLWYLNEVLHICKNLIQFGQFWSGQFLIPFLRNFFGLRSGDLPPCGQELTALQRTRSRSTCTCNSMANTLTSTKITSIFTSGIPNTSSRECSHMSPLCLNVGTPQILWK